MGLRIQTLIVKELLAVWRDPKGRFLLVAMPLIQLIIFVQAMTQEVRHAHIGVLDRDGGRYAADLIARFQGAHYTFAEVLPLGSVAEAEQALEAQRVVMVLHIGPTFSRDIAARRPTEVQFLLDGRKTNASQLLYGYSANIVAQFNAELLAGSPPATTEVLARVWFNPNLETSWSAVPGLVAVLSMTIGLMVTALSVARERELGTFEQLLVSPLSPLEIVIGKTAPALLVGLLQGSLSLAVAVSIYRVPFTGSVALLYAGLAVFLAAIIGVGLFISSLVSTQQQAILGAFMFMVPSVLLSGFATPIENMPGWLQTITRADPLRYFIVIVKGVFLKAMPAGEVLTQIAPMALIEFVTLAAAPWLFRRRAQ